MAQFSLEEQPCAHLHPFVHALVELLRPRDSYTPVLLSLLPCPLARVSSLVPYWHHVGIHFGTCWHHVCTTFVPCRYTVVVPLWYNTTLLHFRITLAKYYVGITLVRNWYRFGTIKYVGTTLVLVWYRFVSTLVLRWCNIGTSLVPRWYHAGTTLIPRGYHTSFVSCWYHCWYHCWHHCWNHVDAVLGILFSCPE